MSVNLPKLLELTVAAREDLEKLVLLEDAIKRAILEQELKSGGNLNLFKLAEKYIKRVKKELEHRENFHGVVIDNNNTYLCNTRSLIKLNQVIPGLPEGSFPEGTLTIIDNIKKNNSVEVVAPDIAELNAQYKIAKAAQRATKQKDITCIEEGNYQLGNTWVNIELLIEVMEFLGDSVNITVNEDTLKPIYLSGDNGEAILLPLRYKKVESCA